jgi:membrane protease subunit HflC
VEKYWVSFKGDELLAENRLSQTINDGMRAEFGQRTVHDVVSGERDNVMDLLRTKADQDARRFGVQVMDVRIKRVDLPTEVSGSVYSRMDAERKRVANELRSTGSAEAEKIRADADRQREIIIAEAYRDAQQIKGEGDGKAAAIYAAAYGKNPEFYAFYRSMDAYRQSFSGKSDVMVLQPNSEFFRYMKSSRGGK